MYIAVFVIPRPWKAFSHAEFTPGTDVVFINSLIVLRKLVGGLSREISGRSENKGLNK